LTQHPLGLCRVRKTTIITIQQKLGQKRSLRHHVARTKTLPMATLRIVATLAFIVTIAPMVLIMARVRLLGVASGVQLMLVLGPHQLHGYAQQTAPVSVPRE
jgi:hypothetical protein